jgi:hypothetical protein
MHESILSYRRQRYLWVASGLAALCAIAYAWHEPAEPPNGGTWLGYTLGTIGAGLILWLIAFGIRKRSYRSAAGTVQGWLSAHVYLGLALLVVVTLHTGFQFGWNIHTLAYALMVVVIASGALGTVLYLRYPARMNALRTGANRGQWLAEVNDLDQKSLRLASRLPPEFAETVASTRDRTVLGGSALALLTGADRSRVLLPGTGGATAVVPNPDQQATLAWLGDRLARSTDGEQGARIQDLLTLQVARRATLARLRDDLRLQAWVEVWLFVHVPVTFALLATLIAHVLAVFLYW